ncbi:hypothetical protein JAB9_21170 [Janthinobacterium sp. HH107]|uniref:hypothetical protein n=1 Tax=Janthinobacterium sp. HH107 TaxID=1537279 RepID=UPI0008939462|nr:hypothetical protein [Janthinobacterium sp. HH107]OEZ99473.1 hypothetical protein JAB9_21170 [Janthinobacterium sp. HH107]
MSKDRHEERIFLKYDKKINLPHYWETKAFLNFEAHNYLREVIFVRLISATEVMLQDYAQIIYSANRESLLGKEVKIDTNLLSTFQTIDEFWSKIVRDECRNLNGRKFSDIIDYYKTKFNINLRRFAEILAIEEMYDQRNILVHALGHTDEVFRKKYNSAQSFLAITDKNLRQCFTNLEAFHEFVRRNSYKKINSAVGINRSFQLVLKIRIHSPSANHLFEPNYLFNFKDKMHFLSSITISNLRNKTEVDLILSGSRALISEYVQILKHVEDRQKVLSVTRRDVMSRSHKTKLSDEKLDEIFSYIRTRPWPEGIKQLISKEMGISKTQISYAFNLILEQEEEFLRRANLTV